MIGRTKNGNGFSWNDHDDNVLKRLWKSGETANQIARALPGRSKNAIIGRVHRLGLHRKSINKGGHPIAKHRKPRVKAKPLWKPAAPAMVPEPQPTLPMLIEGGVPFMQARSHHCRSVLQPRGGPDGLALFCGRRTIDGRSFCPEHAAIYYQPISSVTRRRR